MNKMIAVGLAAMALMAQGAHAQSASGTGDIAYCKALSAKYERYLNMDGKQGMQPQSAEARVAAERCKAGDTSGVPVLEKALEDAKIDLPPKG